MLVQKAERPTFRRWYIHNFLTFRDVLALNRSESTSVSKMNKVYGGSTYT